MECGAVPFVRTNVPQTLMWPESFNNIFGRTSNPYNRSLTPGRRVARVLWFPSKEALWESVLTLEGTEAIRKVLLVAPRRPPNSSICIPSAFCGLYGLRPSPGRVPCGGVVTPLEGQDYILPAFGPMTSSIGRVEAFMKAVTKAKPWLKVSLAVLKKWNEDEYNLTDHDVAWDIWSAGSAEEIMITTSITGEPIIATMELENLDTAKMRGDLLQEYLDYWEATASETGTGRPVDAIICPVAPFVATPHGKNRSYPATIFPVTTVDPNLDAKKPHDFYDDFYKGIYQMYGSETFKNVPVCLQLVWRTLEDEAVVKMTEIVNAALAAAK
ncbi:hypothetical protein AZE42_05609 [Rhizopogon vesiculosus]|uniref:Amidase domain-containing protein n=1 Tax=Rhizopogon vesiculosus TaxID=180088 RepID=A0A1J8QGL1_9AGAM|nr:hypothetical protein AZE42_05609 [Rhizopogon vesiculosus]